MALGPFDSALALLGAEGKGSLATAFGKTGSHLGLLEREFKELSRLLGLTGAGAATTLPASGSQTGIVVPKADPPNTELDAMRDAFKTAAENIKIDVLDLTSSLDAAFQTLGRSLMQAVVKPINDTVSGWVSKAVGGILDFAVPTLFGHPKAGGGRLQPGTPTLIGERGPELVVAHRPATVMNAADTRGAVGSGVTVQQTLNFDLVPAPTIGAMIENAMPAIVEASKMAVLSSLRRGA